MGRGHRYMYNLTGQPGWMRLGYSPGWVGRSASGLGPCADYMMTGQWPAPTIPFNAYPVQAGDLEMLKTQAARLEQMLGEIHDRISKLEETGG